MNDQELIARWRRTDELVRGWDSKEILLEQLLEGLTPDQIGEGLDSLDEKALVTEVYTIVRRIEAAAYLLRNAGNRVIAQLAAAAEARIGAFLREYLAKQPEDLSLDAFLYRQRLEWALGILEVSLPRWDY